MTYVLVFGSILCGWAVLSVLGGERTRRLQEWEASKPLDEPPAPPAASAPANSGKPHPHA